MLHRTNCTKCGSFRPLFENPLCLLCLIEARTARLRAKRKAKLPCAAIKPDREKVLGKTSIRLCHTKRHEGWRTQVWKLAMTDEENGSWANVVRAYEDDR